MGMWKLAGVMLLAVWLVSAGGPALARSPKGKKVPFSPQELGTVLRSLRERGFPQEKLTAIFHDTRLNKIDRVIGLNAMNQESARIYKPFLNRYAMGKATRFRKRHFARLWENERRFGVPMNIVVAILLVETQFGTAYLPYRVMDVFTTLVVEASPAAVKRHYERLKPKHPELVRGFLEMRLGNKAEWALEQLTAILSIGLKTGIDILEIRGSYAGAFGLPQFLPTSYQRWAVDGNGDELVDLDNMADALASIANFLKSHGWRLDAVLEEKRKAVWEYNRSPPYVDAIFAISRKLGLPSRKRRGYTMAPTTPEERAAEKSSATHALVSQRAG